MIIGNITFISLQILPDLSWFHSNSIYYFVEKEDSEEKSLRPARKRAIVSDSESEDEASEKEGRESGESEESGK